MVDSVIFRESDIERRTADAVRDDLKQHLRTGWDREETATRLGLVPVGLDSLMNRYWSFEEAFRIAHALGLNFGDKLSESERRAA